MPTESNLVEAIRAAIGNSNRKQLEIWRSVSRRYPATTYDQFDRLMGKLELLEVIALTGSRGPNIQAAEVVAPTSPDGFDPRG